MWKRRDDKNERKGSHKREKTWRIHGFELQGNF